MRCPAPVSADTKTTAQSATAAAASVAASRNDDRKSLLDFDSVAELLTRFASELQVYAHIHGVVIQAEMHMQDDVQLPAHYVTRTDPTLVLNSALRAAIGFSIS